MLYPRSTVGFPRGHDAEEFQALCAADLTTACTMTNTTTVVTTTSAAATILKQL